MGETELHKLESQKKGLESNRNLCGALCVFLLYVTFKDVKTNPGSVLFYIVMGLLTAVAIGLAIRDTVLIERIKKKMLEDGE